MRLSGPAIGCFLMLTKSHICPDIMPQVPHLQNKDKVFLIPSLPHCAAVEENLVGTGVVLVL